MSGQHKSKGGAWSDPLLRPIVAATVPGTGVDVVVEPNAEEREALAEALDLDGVERLRAEYRLGRRAGGIISVKGRLKALVRPTCIVTLEPFDMPIDEAIDMRFIEPRAESRPDTRAGHTDAQGHQDAVSGDVDPPDVIENGQIDLGRVTTEFLSLAVPAFPRKPGVDFASAEPDEPRSPFAGLARLKDQKD